LPTLNPGAGKVKIAWLWAYARDDRTFGGAGPPMVAYRFEDSRSGDCAARHLGDYRGILQCDGYAGYRKLAGGPHSNGMRLAGCWAHLRRKFFDLHANGESVVATVTISEMRQLWAVEDQVRGQSTQARLAARRASSVAIVQALFDLWERELPLISGKSKLAEAIRYARSHRAALELFLADGRVEIDSNIVERAIRPQAITRKNSLFAGSVGGGRTWAAVATMLQTCKMNDVDPYAWMKQTLERIANRWPNSDIEALMPWNFRPVS
jgi:transposase